MDKKNPAPNKAPMKKKDDLLLENKLFNQVMYPEMTVICFRKTH